MKKKSIALVVALALVVVCIIGGTLAWLTATTGEIKNTFTTSDINIKLEEHMYDPATDALTENTTTSGVDNYKMIPGWTIPKDPQATVSAGSEKCYLFVKVEKSQNFDSYMTFSIDSSAWTELDKTNYPGVYYIKIDNADKMNRPYNILGSGKKPFNNVEYTWSENQVLVNPTVTKEMMNDLAKPNAIQPALTFTAYASQYMKNNTESFTAIEAWENAQPTASN